MENIKIRCHGHPLMQPADGMLTDEHGQLSVEVADSQANRVPSHLTEARGPICPFTGVSPFRRPSATGRERRNWLFPATTTRKANRSTYLL